jgi:LPXTG-site transpeptidase (sortase) family protein
LYRPTPTSTPPSVPTPPPDEPVRNRGGRARTPTPPPIVEVVTPIQPIVPIIPIVLPIVPILPNTGINEESRIETPHMFTNFLHFRNTDDDIKLIIPSILIDTTLGVSGISNKGEVEVSSDPSVATWFNESVKIGKKGTSVVSGHYGWKDKKVAVFDKLHQLKVGDKVYIEENNIITSFVVREIKIYSLKDDAKLVFHSDDDKSHLNLITCSGKWDSVNKTYLERLVVFADKE